jgi:hypothetical protein
MATDLETPASGPPPSAGARGSVTPGWLAEVLEVLVLRRSVLVATALGLSLLGVLTAMVVPQFLPPRPLVGAAVGLAAVLLAVAAALGIDSVDLTVRGPRHVRASGGRLGAEVAGPPDVRAVAGLAAGVARRAAEGRGRVGLVAAAEDGPDPLAWADALARALSARGLRVLLVDLMAERSAGPGVAEVAAGEARIAQAVGFDHELLLATLGPGGDRHAALAGLPVVVDRLPSDIEVLLVALPHLSEPGALGAAGSLDRLAVLVEEDHTARVDLIAALDAIDETEAGSDVVLLREAPPTPLDDATPSPAVAADPARLEDPTGPIPAVPVSAEEPAVWSAEVVDPSVEAPSVETPSAEATPLDEGTPTPGADGDAAESPEPPAEDRPGDLETQVGPAGAEDEPAAAVPDAATAEEDEPLAERDRWARPARHDEVIGSHLAAGPFPEHDDLPEDPVRLAAALQTLAAEVWWRGDDEPGNGADGQG